MNHRQELFCNEYCVDHNATQAAIRAGYSLKTAYSIGQENLKKPEIATRIAEIQRKEISGIQLTVERILLEIERLALFDVRSIFDEYGNFLPVTEWPDGVAANVKQIEFNGYGMPVKVQFWDKGKQLELAARCKGMLTDKLQLSNSKDAPLTLADFYGTNAKPGAK